MKNRVAIIGTGNVAYHLSRVLMKTMSLVNVSRKVGTGDWQVPVIGYDELVGHKLDAVFLAVPDGAIASVSKLLVDHLPPTLPIIHLSGATPLDAIDGRFINRGVMWPIRSLRKGAAAGDWKDLPLAIYANTEVAKRVLLNLSHRLSESVTWLDDQQRARLHLAAVFSNNFVTALYEISYRLCAEYAVPFELLLPIIQHTAGAQDFSSPASRQTGAAARQDYPTMERHLSELKDPVHKAIYRQLSDLILQHGLAQDNLDLGSNAHDNLED